MVETSQQSKLQYKQYNQKEYTQIKAWRKTIYKETKEISDKNYYINKENEKIELGITKKNFEDNLFIDNPDAIKKKFQNVEFKQINSSSLIQINDNSYTQLSKLTKLFIINGDSLEVAMKFVQKGFKVAVLNMASDANPGGGVTNGAGAQEESLFRRSNYFQYLLPNKNSFYPIPIYGGILSSNVAVFRAPEKSKYELLSRPFKVDFIAVAAIRSPKIIKSKTGQKLGPKEQQITEKKVETILTLASAAQAQCVILGAFGCGAFHNPPESISTIFKNVILEKFNDVFQCIVFAIIEDHNSPSLGNIAPFEICFEMVSKQIDDLIL